MVPKASREVDSDLIVQAVILGDSYDIHFQPLTSEKPRCLLPLCNTPLIEYTLESLAVAGVHQVFVLCCAHAEQIKTYIESSKWGRAGSSIKVETLISRETMSVGDALRELDARQLITSDFILISGDVVSNVSIREFYDAHRKRREVEKNAIMTMIVKEASANHRTRNGIFILNPLTHECLSYESIPSFPTSRIAVNRDVFEKCPEFEVRTDLIDCHIDICSFEVLALFTENFDYQDIRRDFVHGVLTSDLLGHTIYCAIVQGYAARAGSTKAYDAISKDILERWTFPIVMDSNLLSDQRYNISKGFIYKEPMVILSRTCELEKAIGIGSMSTVGDNVRIGNSVLGRRCHVSAGSTLFGSYLWDNCRVGARCVISESILGENVRILDGVTIDPGCMIAANVIIGPDVHLPRGTRLSLPPTDVHDDTGRFKILIDPRLVGVSGNAVRWENSNSEDEDLEVDKLQDIGALDIIETPDTSSESSVDDVDSVEDEFGDFNYMNSAQEAYNQDIKKEIRQTIERAFAEQHEVDIAALELNTLRMASNTTYHQIRQEIIPAIFDQVKTDGDLAVNLSNILKRWGALISKMVHSEADEADVVQILQAYCSKDGQSSRFFAICLRFMYEVDITSEEGLLRWFTSPESREGSDNFLGLHKAAEPFMEWLANAEVESSDDE